MTTLVRPARAEVFRDYLSERDLAERWGVSVRTVQRRIGGASLSPVGVEDRLPHFHRRDVEAYEASKSIAVRAGQSRRLKSPIFSVCVAHRKGGQSKTSSCFYLARELSAAGKRVVLRDLDAQRSLTKILRALGTPEDEFGRLTFLRRVALVPDGAPLPFKPDIELIDTPPALDDSVPGILRADALIIPLLTEFQGVLALQDMLEYLAATRDKHPCSADYRNPAHSIYPPVAAPGRLPARDPIARPAVWRLCIRPHPREQSSDDLLHDRAPLAARR